MATFDLLMPKLGESIEEATITKWFVKAGDAVEDDDVLLEIATDKVDSEIPSPVSGTVSKILIEQDQTVAVGTVIAVIDMDGGEVADEGEVSATTEKDQSTEDQDDAADQVEAPITNVEKPTPKEADAASTDRFYSPLVLTIANKEGISMDELNAIEGSGQNGRVQKKDVLNYLEQRREQPEKQKEVAQQPEDASTPGPAADGPGRAGPSPSASDEIIEMDRMRKLIADHMIKSKQTSAHVTNMLEADVTEIVRWRNNIKEAFASREGEKITYLPVFLEATIKALRDFPLMNASVDGTRIIVKKDINLGIAVALPSGNLIVPVIKQADTLNLVGITKKLNQLARDARNNKLSPDDIQGGTFTVTNFGTFRNAMGTPIINQPEVAILAVGNVEKKPAVIETPSGDVIAIRHKMFLSITYDHRIIDGAYGGAFLRKLADYLEEFDGSRKI